ncbi:unnamed protein product [Oikopleura dioica]|uniref:Uncharacterized protein n=1 Tax=Oikopleura dioica TaxID=34765 RepID=E4XCT3_OIKDI|nr:unnamed protein product [Oikopleura dioica]
MKRNLQPFERFSRFHDQFCQHLSTSFNKFKNTPFQQKTAAQRLLILFFFSNGHAISRSNLSLRVTTTRHAPTGSATPTRDTTVASFLALVSKLEEK